MRGKSWKKVADEQYQRMPKNWQDDWRDLRSTVYR